MNRNLLVALTLVIAAVAFGAATFFTSDDLVTPVQTVASDTGATLPNEDATPNELLIRPHSPVLGKVDAPVTIVEFFDPACEACRAFHPTVKQILADNPDDVRVVIRYTPFHGEASETAVALLEAARAQELFEPILEALLARQPEWASHTAPAAQKALTIAAEAGLDMREAQVHMKSPMTIGVMNADRADVLAVGVKGTPTFFINGKPLDQFGRQQLVAAVEREIEAVR